MYRISPLQRTRHVRGAGARNGVPHPRYSERYDRTVKSATTHMRGGGSQPHLCAPVARVISRVEAFRGGDNSRGMRPIEQPPWVGVRVGVRARSGLGRGSGQVRVGVGVRVRLGSSTPGGNHLPAVISPGVRVRVRCLQVRCLQTPG